MALFYAVGHWNQYFDALIYLSDRNIYPAATLSYAKSWCSSR